MKGSQKVQEQRFLYLTLRSYAELLLAIGDSQQARLAYQESLSLAREVADLDPNNVENQDWFAWIWSICPFPDMDTEVDVVGRLEQAIAHSSVRDLDEQITFGWAYLRLHQWTKAKSAFQEYMNKHSEDAIAQTYALIGLGWTQWRLGERDNAHQSYKVAKEQIANQGARKMNFTHKRLLGQFGRALEITVENRNDVVDEHRTKEGER